MPLLEFPPLIDTSSLDLEEFQPVRMAAKELVEKVAPNATVYPFFELEFDPDTLQRKVTPLLRGQNADANIYHAWMVGITAANLVRTSEGNTEFVGGFAFTWNLTLEFEGFLDPKGDDPWQTIENEIIKITVIFFRNMDMILENAKFYEVEWPSIDLEAFADGNNLIVAQGSCRVDLQMSIQA